MELLGVKIVFDNNTNLFIRCDTRAEVTHLIKDITKHINRNEALIIDGFLSVNTDKIMFVSSADELVCSDDLVENKVFEEY